MMIGNGFFLQLDSFLAIVSKVIRVSMLEKLYYYMLHIIINLLFYYYIVSIL